MGRWRLHPVEPIGVHAGQTVHGPLTLPVYPPPPVDFRSARQRSERTLRAAARHVGLLPSELSALETGAARLDDDQAAELVRLLAAEIPGAWRRCRALVVDMPGGRLRECGIVDNIDEDGFCLVHASSSCRLVSQRGGMPGPGSDHG